MYNIEFTTSCYEKDWELLLKTDRLQLMVEACNYIFSKKKVYINNVKDYDKVADAAEQLIQNGLIDQYIRVADYEEEVTDFFKINKSEVQGYYYLIQFLTLIYFSEGDYHLNFTADAILTNDVPWIDPAINVLQSNDKIIVANALFDGKIHQAMRESFADDPEFYISYGFSDQCFLVDPSVFRADIYNEQNPLSEFYPAQSRHSFEERIYRFMRNHDYHRITHKKAHYLHKNFPKNAFKTWLALHTPINNKKYGITR